MKAKELIRLLEQHCQPEDEVKFGWYDFEFQEMIWETVSMVLPTGKHSDSEHVSPNLFAGLLSPSGARQLEIDEMVRESLSRYISLR